MTTRFEILTDFFERRRATGSDRRALAALLAKPFFLPRDLEANDLVDINPCLRQDYLLNASTGGVEIVDRDDAEAILRRIVGATRRQGRPRATRKTVIDITVDAPLLDAINAAAERAGVPRAKFCRDILAAAVGLQK